MSNTSSTPSGILYDVEYLIKYPDLVLAIFGLVTNMIHIFFLSRKFQSFIFLTFIAGADLLQCITVGAIQIRAVLVYVYYRNCIGYINYVDSIYKFVNLGLYGLSMLLGPWITVVMILCPVGSTMKYAKRTLMACSIYSTLFFVTMTLLFLHIPYAPCSVENLAQKYLEQEDVTWITVVATTIFFMEGILKLVVFGCYLILLCWLTYKILVKEKNQEKVKIFKLNLYLLLSFCVPDILSLILFQWLMRNDTETASQYSLTLPAELDRLLRTIFACIRPFLILWKCEEYQDTVKAFFVVFDGDVQVSKGTPAVQAWES